MRRYVIKQKGDLNWDGCISFFVRDHFLHLFSRECLQVLAKGGCEIEIALFENKYAYCKEKSILNL